MDSSWRKNINRPLLSLYYLYHPGEVFSRSYCTYDRLLAW